MEALLHVIEQYGLWVVFICVLLDQGGLPVPAYPPIIVTAAIAVDSDSTVLPIVLVAALAALIADLIWFTGGRKFGGTLLRLMCRVSLSPDSCVGTTRRMYGRWGAPSLIFAKYVPGFAAIATTLAGETGTSTQRFILFDGIGAVLWAAGAVAIGVVFHEAVEAVLLQLELLGQYAVVVLLFALIAFVLWKWWKRQQFLARIRMDRISIEALVQLLRAGSSVTIVDVRSAERRASTGWIPGSIHVDDVMQLDLSPTEHVVIYCDCPNDASAAVAARKLQERGYDRVRPLAGGIDAWREHGLAIDVHQPAEAMIAATPG